MKKGLVFLRRAGGGKGNVVSLFPFLAVLLCTMGALIMLLVVIAQSVRQQADTAPDTAPVADVQLSEPVPEPVPDADPEIVSEPEEIAEKSAEETPEEADERPTREEAETMLRLLRQQEEDAAFFAGELKESRKKLDEKLAEERAKLAYLEKQTQSKREELKRLAQVVRELEKSGADRSEATEELRKEVDAKNAELAQAEKELEKLRQKSLTQPKSYAIVPFKGRDGTFRKPMFIECRENKLILQPEGIELGEADLLVGDRPDNPLDAALRAQRQYMLETGQLGPDEEPYPLFVVRPSGIDMFSGARAALGSWHNEFGYELVEENVAIEYPITNPELKDREETQIAVARERCAGYLAFLREEMRRRPAPQFRVGPGGQVERIDSGGPDFSRRGFGSGSAGSGLAQSTRPPRGNADSQPRSLSGVPFDARSGSPSDPLYDPSQGLAEKPGGSTMDGKSRMIPNVLPETGAPGTAPGTPPGTTAPKGIAPATTAEYYPGGRPASSTSGNANDDGSIFMLDTFPGGNAPTSLEPPVISREALAENAEKTGTAYAVSPNGTVPPGGESTNDASESATERTFAPSPPGFARTADAQRLALQNRQGGRSGAPTPSGGTASPNATVGDGSVDLGIPDPSYDSQSGQQSGLAQGPGSSASPELRGAQPTMLQTPTVNFGTNMQPDNWGLPDAAAQSTAVTRSVKIRCDRDAITLLQQPGLRRAVRVEVDPRAGLAAKETRDAFVEAIWDYMESWGIAGPRMYWQPVLKIDVAPDAEQRFKELEHTLHNSGILVERN